MYQRYAPKPVPNPPQQQGQRPNPSPQEQKPTPTIPEPPRRTGEKKQPPPGRKNPVLGMIPPALYNPETKKVLGVLSAEDLLLAGLIFLLLENEELEDPMLLYALVYILISDYIDLPF